MSVTDAVLRPGSVAIWRPPEHSIAIRSRSRTRSSNVRRLGYRQIFSLIEVVGRCYQRVQKPLIEGRA